MPASTSLAKSFYKVAFEAGDAGQAGENCLAGRLAEHPRGSIGFLIFARRDQSCKVITKSLTAITSFLLVYQEQWLPKISGALDKREVPEIFEIQFQINQRRGS